MPSSMPSSVVAVSCDPSLAEMSAALSAFAKCCVRAALLAPPATPAHGSVIFCVFGRRGWQEVTQSRRDARHGSEVYSLQFAHL